MTDPHASPTAEVAQGGRPSRLALIVTTVIAVAGAAGAVALSSFLPSPRWSELALYPALAYGVLATITLARMPDPLPHLGLRGAPWLKIPLLGIGCAGFGYIAFLISMPFAYTAWFGEPSTRVVTVETWSRPGKFGVCENLRLEEAWTTLCTRWPREMTPRGTRLIVTGKATAFGITIDHYDIDASATVLP